MPHSPLLHKRILFLGSSVTYGHCSGGVAFPELLAEATGCEAVKEAVSGTTLVPGEWDYVQRLHAMTADIADLFICQLSTNDATQNKPLPEVEAAVRHIIDYARGRWRCPVAFYTSPRYDSAAYQAMATMLLRVAEETGVAVLDLWNDAAFNAANDARRADYMADRLHPTLEGYRALWTPAFRAFCAGLLTPVMTRADADDAPAVLALYNSVKGRPGCLWDEEYPCMESIVADLQQGGLYLLKEGVNILAAVSVTYARELDDLPFWTPVDRPACEIARVCVTPARQGQGLAKRLMRLVITALTDTGAVHLLVSPVNPAACGVYASLGFRAVGKCFRYGHDYVAMELLP